MKIVPIVLTTVLGTTSISTIDQTSPIALAQNVSDNYWRGQPRVVLIADNPTWKFGYLSPRNIGSHYTDILGDTYNANQTWLAVPFVLKNNSNQTQQRDNLMIGSRIRSGNNTYDPSLMVFTAVGDNINPYDPGEARKGLFLFDVPSHIINAEQLILQGWSDAPTIIDF